MDKWQRVSKVAIVDFFVRKSLKSLQLLLYMIPLSWVSVGSLSKHPMYIVMALAILLLVLVMVAWLEYYFFKYRLKDGKVEIHSGIFFKKHLDLPFGRIQHVKLITPVYFRALDYTNMELDTAGSANNEARLVAISLTSARAMKQHILTHQLVQSSAESLMNGADEQGDDVTNGRLLNRRTLTDLIIHGLTNNRVLVLLAMLAPLADTILEYTSSLTGNLQFDLSHILFQSNLLVWQQLLYISALIFTVFVVVVLLSIGGSIMAYYGYQLRQRDDSFIQCSGLFSLREVVMKQPRLQMIACQQGWLDVLIKRLNLKFLQVGGVEQQHVHNQLMVPSINAQQASALVNLVWPNNQLMSVHYHGISARFILHALLLVALPITMVISCVGFVLDKWQWHLMALLFFILCSVMIFYRWKRWGYAMDEHYIYIRKGLVGVSYYSFAINKIQLVKVKQSALLRHYQLAHINFVTAASTLTLPFINRDMAWHLVARSLYQVESMKKSWM